MKELNSKYYSHIQKTARHAEKEIEEGLQLLNKIDRKAISIFGSHAIAEDNKYYKQCENTAYELGKRGYAIITGGGPGIMQAANTGATRAGTISIGIKEKLLRKEQSVSSKIYTSEISLNFLFVRRFILIIKSDALIFYPGGYGTLNEFFECITLIVTHIADKVPVIFVNKKYWYGLYTWLRDTALKDRMISKADLGLISFADTTEEILKIIEKKG